MPVYAYNDKAPVIDDAVLIMDGAVIVGDVTIKKGASIWFHAVIRADMAPIVIGEETSIQDLCTLHVDEDAPLSISDRVTVGHGCIIHGCRIEEDCLIGMGAVILNGARIGRGSVVAAGAVVLEKTDIPPFSLVAGVPAKIKRKVDDTMFEDTIRDAVQDYNQLVRNYKRGELREMKRI